LNSSGVGALRTSSGKLFQAAGAATTTTSARLPSLSKYGISSTLLRRLQSIQNAAARLVTGAKKFDHITPVLWELHWLPTRQRIAYNKLSFPMHKCLQNAAQVYLSSDCVPLSSLAGRRHLRCSVSGTLDSQPTRTVLDRRTFSVRPCDVERSADRTAYCYRVSSHFRQKN